MKVDSVTSHFLVGGDLRRVAAALIGANALIASLLIVGPATATPPPILSGYSTSEVVPAQAANIEKVQIDPPRHRTYILTSDNTVSVLNSSTQALVATVPLVNPSDITLNPTTNMIYAVGETDDGFGQLSVINGSTDTVTLTVTLSLVPSSVLVDPTTNIVSILSAHNGQYAHLTSFMGATNTVGATVYTGYAADGFAIDPNSHTVWISTPDSQSRVLAFDETTGSLVHQYFFLNTVANVTFDLADNSFFVTDNNNDVEKVDIATGTAGGFINSVTLDSPIGRIVVDAARNRLYVNNNYQTTHPDTVDTFTVLNASSGAVVGVVPSGAAAGSMVLDPTTGILYFTADNFEIDALATPAAAEPLPPSRSATPLAQLTTIYAAPQVIYLRGWAVEPLLPTAQLTMSVQIDDGSPLPLAAYLEDPESGLAVPVGGDHHEFYAGYGLAAGSHSVCVSASSVGPTRVVTSLGCHTVLVPSPSAVHMNGEIDAVTVSPAGEITVSGWAARPDQINAVVPLRIQFAGQTTTFATGMPTTTGAQNLAGPNQGFSGSFAAPSGWQTFCVFATPTSGSDVQLACSELFVPRQYITLPQPVTLPSLGTASTATDSVPVWTELGAASVPANVPSSELTQLKLANQRDLRVLPRAS
jgi:hypothetical protein